MLFVSFVSIDLALLFGRLLLTRDGWPGGAEGVVWLGLCDGGNDFSTIGFVRTFWLVLHFSSFCGVSTRTVLMGGLPGMGCGRVEDWGPLVSSLSEFFIGLLALTYSGRKGHFLGGGFWAGGFCIVKLLCSSRSGLVGDGCGVDCLSPKVL